jgi:hypothetical protein
VAGRVSSSDVNNDFWKLDISIFPFAAEQEKTNRELKIKEKDMQLHYLDKFIQTAIDRDISKRIRLAHYISSTIDDQEYKQLPARWTLYYNSLLKACRDQLKAAMDAGKADLQQELSNEPACTIGGLETLKPVRAMPPDSASPRYEPDRSGPGGVLGELIARSETGKAGYGAFNRGRAGDSDGETIDFSQMTIAEIIAQQSLPRGSANRLFAVGKYFVIPSTMREAISKFGSEIKFTTSVQEQIFRNYLIDVKNATNKELYHW